MSSLISSTSTTTISTQETTTLKKQPEFLLLPFRVLQKTSLLATTIQIKCIARRSKKHSPTPLTSLNQVQCKSKHDQSQDFVLYNAGTDCMENDPLGNMNLSPEGIIQRDYIVFQTCLQFQVPLTMVLSGGYQQVNAPTIADSIKNILQKLHLN